MAKTKQPLPHAFKPGQTKTPGSGRKAGVPNKKTAEFMLMLEEKGFDPGAAYVELFQEQMRMYNEVQKAKRRAPTAGQSILADASATLNNICQFVYPKKKAIEHSGEVGVKTFADFMALAKGKKD